MSDPALTFNYIVGKSQTREIDASIFFCSFRRDGCLTARVGRHQSSRQERPETNTRLGAMWCQ